MSIAYESAALESPGPGGSLKWVEHMSGHWTAQGLGGKYDIYPRGSSGYTAYWSQAGTGSTHELGSYDTLGAAFGAARRHADGERRQTAAAEGDVDSGVHHHIERTARQLAHYEIEHGGRPMRHETAVRYFQDKHNVSESDAQIMAAAYDRVWAHHHGAGEASGDVSKDVARKAVASAYGAGQIETVTGSGNRYTVTLKSGKRLHVAVDGSTGTVTDPDDGHVVTTHTVSEAAGECDQCAHKHPKSVPTEPCRELTKVVSESREKPIVIEKTGEHSWVVFVQHNPIVNVAKRGTKPELSWKGRKNYVAGAKRHIFKTRGEAENIAHQIGRYVLNLGDFVFSYVEYKNDVPSAEETVPVIHEANDAGPFATMDRDIAELSKGHKLGEVHTPEDVYKLVHDVLSKESQEVFLVLPMDIHSQLLSRPVEIARGQRDRVSIGISDVMRPVIATNASRFVVVHNHPSGRARPSPKDKELTDTIRKHTLPDVVFCDHVVVGLDQFYSFTENKLFKVR